MGWPAIRRAAAGIFGPSRVACQALALALVLCAAPRAMASGDADSTDGAAADTLTIHFLDVGQGDGILLQLPSGKNVLIDGGAPHGKAEVQLKELGVERIDLMIASHADYDHAGVHETILAEFDVVNYLTNGKAHTSQSYARITALAAQQVESGDLTVFRASDFKPGQNLGSGGVGLRLMPPPVVAHPDQNTQSIGLVVTFGEFKALMTGDSEKSETDAWLMRGRYRRLISDVDVYKSIHHGARNGDAGNEAWLGKVAPEVVVICVGKNSYGHPADATIEAYEGAGARVLRTDVDGGVRVRVAADGSYEVEAGQRLRPPPELSPDEQSRAAVGSTGTPPMGEACPAERPIKGNQGSNGWIFHSPGQAYYEATRPEACFSTAEEAEAAGYRASKR